MRSRPASRPPRWRPRDRRALRVEPLAGPHAAPARAADHVRGPGAGERVDVIGNGGEGHEHGARHVAVPVLVGLAHVDDARAGREPVGELIDVDLLDCHRANIPSVLLGGRQIVGRVDVAERAGRHRHLGVGHRRDQFVQGAGAAVPGLPQGRRGGGAPCRERVLPAVRDGHRRVDAAVDERRHQRGDRRRVECRQVARGDDDVVVGRGAQRGQHPTAGSLTREVVRDRGSSEPRQEHAVAADQAHRVAAGRLQRGGHALGHRHAAHLDERLVGAHAAAPAAAEHRPGGHEPARGGPSGSSCTRNVATRSASSASPIAAAIAPNPASARRNPRFVGSDQRT